MKSVYKYSSESGLPVGVYLTAMSACVFMSSTVPVMSMLFFLLLIGFPFFLAYLMIRVKKIEPSYSKFASLWLFGIYSVIFGVLICSLCSGLYLTFVNPTFITDYVTNALVTIESSPLAGQYAETSEMMHRAIDEHLLPGGMEFVVSMGWLTCFSGSMLSMVLAGILRGKPQSDFRF